MTVKGQKIPQYRYDGPNAKKHISMAQYTKLMAAVHGVEIFPDMKLPRAKRSDVGIARGTIEQPERELRNAVIKRLREMGFEVMRLENAITGKNQRGLPDLLVFGPSISGFHFIELKATTGLRPEQEKFRQRCEKARISYIVIQSLNECEELCRK